MDRPSTASPRPPGPPPGLDGRIPLLFANVLLFAYVADAQLSVLDGLVLRPLGVFALALPRELVAAATVWVALAWLFSGWARPRLPTWLFFLPAVSVLWLNWTAGAPLPFFFDPWSPQTLITVLTGIQAAIAVAMLLHVRRRWGRWYVPAAALAASAPGLRVRIGRGLRHGGVLAAVALLLAPFLLLQGLQDASGGWLLVRPDGLHLSDAVLRDARGRRVRLVGMAHVGEAGAYRSIFESLAAPGAVVLEEGVSDREGLLGRPTRPLEEHRVLLPRDPRRLVAQPDIGQFLPTRRLGSLDEATARPGETLAVFRSDVDAAELSEPTRAFVRWGAGVLGDGLRGGPWLAALEAGPPDEGERFLQEVLHDRNAVLLGYVDRALARFDEVVVPWGALHMPELAAALRERGFTLDRGSVRRHRIVSWRARRPERVTGENFPDLHRFDPRSFEAWLDHALARRYAEARPGWLFRPATDAEPAVAGTWFGGLPTRFEGEAWPRNPATGRPMSFLAELTRSEENAAFLGRIARLRVFVDYDGFFGGDEQHAYAVWITPVGAPPRPVVSWSEEELAALEAAFGESEYGAVFRTAPQPVTARTRRTVSIGLLEAPTRLSRPELRDWFELEDALEASWADRHPDVVEAVERSLLGGRPFWVQSEETQPLPFFLQLYPDGPLMWGDGGHLYLYLDPEHPEAGMILSGQMG